MLCELYLHKSTTQKGHKVLIPTEKEVKILTLDLVKYLRHHWEDNH